MEFHGFYTPNEAPCFPTNARPWPPARRPPEPRCPAPVQPCNLPRPGRWFWWWNRTTVTMVIYPLVNVYSLLLKMDHRNSGFSHWKWWFSLFFVCLPEGSDYSTMWGPRPRERSVGALITPMSRTGLWYANNELVTGANLNQLITGGPHIVPNRGMTILPILGVWMCLVHCSQDSKMFWGWILPEV